MCNYFAEMNWTLSFKLFPNEIKELDLLLLQKNCQIFQFIGSFLIQLLPRTLRYMSTSEHSDFDSIKIKESKLILKSQFKEVLILSESSTRKHLKSFQRWKIKELAGNYCEFLDNLCKRMDQVLRSLMAKNLVCLEVHAVFFRLLMKGIFDPYVLWLL